MYATKDYSVNLSLENNFSKQNVSKIEKEVFKQKEKSEILEKNYKSDKIEKKIEK